jgi:cytochrome c oxidase subunit 3
MALITTTAAVDATGVLLADYGRIDHGSAAFSARLRRARLGLIVALTGVVMIFVSFSSAYVVRKGLPTLDPQSGILVHDWLPLQLPSFLLVNTLVLLVSTLTMELARRQAAREALATGIGKSAVSTTSASHKEAQGMPWLALTAVLGLSFLAGQWLVWRELAASGFYVSTNPSSSFFYLLTATHGIHLLGGILTLIAASAAYFWRRLAESRVVVVDITAWYWHFMTFLWVYILCLLEVAH